MVLQPDAAAVLPLRALHFFLLPSLTPSTAAAATEPDLQESSFEGDLIAGLGVVKEDKSPNQSLAEALKPAFQPLGCQGRGARWKPHPSAQLS